MCRGHIAEDWRRWLPKVQSKVKLDMLWEGRQPPGCAQARIGFPDAQVESSSTLVGKLPIPTCTAHRHVWKIPETF